MKAHKLLIVTLITAAIAYSGHALLSKEKTFEIINVDNISDYNQDRVVYQRIEKYVDPMKDGSIEALLIIQNKKTYLMMDGFDALTDVQVSRMNTAVQNKYMLDEDYWVNKINGKPDYVRTIYRRSDLLINANEEFVTTNFGSFYRSVRDKLLNKHVEKFRNLMRNRGESDMHVSRKLLPMPVYMTEEERKKPKYAIAAKAKAKDETIYYCEDADGDGVTESFWVHGGDGFDWGYKSGPNIIFIYNNQDKDVETIIGKLANESVYGSVEDEKEVIKTFPKENEVKDMIEWVTPLDEFYHD